MREASKLAPTVTADGFGEILTRYRAGAGISQASLAEIAGLSVETIGALERGARRAPYRATIDALAEALHVGDAGRQELLAAADRSRARTFAKHAPLAGASSALPGQLTPCIGRSREIADILGLLDETRILTVTGSAGIGKTRILVEVAERLPPSRRDAVRFVDLAALESSDYLLSCIAVACESSVASHCKTIESLIEYLRPQRLLLLLDNCEHVIEDVAFAVASIVRNCPNVAFLATSRERLAISGETIYRLPSLSPQAGLDLMLERISALNADIFSRDDDASALADICSALDHIPLAIELAAGRIATLGPQAVLERLKNGLALSGGARDLPARQQTMVAAIAWSYSLLEGQEQDVLNRLSVFSSGFMLEAAVSVCGSKRVNSGQVADLILGLVDKSLINAHLAEETVRYTMFEVIRAFARERLTESTETADFLQRHAEWYGDFADQVTSTRVVRAPVALRAYLEPELHNVRSALQWSLDYGRNPVLAGRMLAGLGPLWQYDERNAEGARWAEAALAQLDATQVPVIASALLTKIIRWTRGVAAGPWIQRALEVTTLTGDRKRMLDLQQSLAVHYFRIGEIAAADDAATRTMAIIERDGLVRDLDHARLLGLRVWIHIERGRFTEAQSDISTGEAIHIALGEPEPLNWWLTRAYLSYAMSDVAEALRVVTCVIDRASALREAYTEELLAAYAYASLFKLATGSVDEARTAAREVLLRTRKRNDYWPYTSIALLAVVAARSGRAGTASRLLGFIESWHESQSYLPTIAQRETMEMARSAIAEQIAGDAPKLLEAEVNLELGAAIEAALSI